MSSIRSQCLRVLPIAVILLLAACYRQGYTAAPVVNVVQPAAVLPTGTKAYRVKKGDTLYSIAWAYGLDYRGLAAANCLPPPYRIHPGQLIRLKTAPVPQTMYAASASKTVPKKWRNKTVWASNQPVRRWLWPARGRIVAGFERGRVGNKGLDIGGHPGQAVRSAATGVVVYSGDGVRGYGNLIIIKHNNNYLSAYAFNRRNLVRVGERVQAGQMIAKMGRNNAGRVMLHFEIRRNGIPINPRTYLR